MHVTFDVFVVTVSYVHIITEHGSRSILQPTLMGSAVQNPGKHQVQGQLLLHRGIIKAPAPAATKREERRRLMTKKKINNKV